MPDFVADMERWKREHGDAKPTIAVDWDGTLVESAWPDHGDWLHNAVESLHFLKDHTRPVIYTARIAPVNIDLSPRTKAEVAYEISVIRRKLDDAGLPEIEIHTDPWKPSALVYIDDRAIRFTGTRGAWRATVRTLMGMLGKDTVNV